MLGGEPMPGGLSGIIVCFRIRESRIGLLLAAVLLDEVVCGVFSAALPQITQLLTASSNVFFSMMTFVIFFFLRPHGTMELLVPKPADTPTEEPGMPRSVPGSPALLVTLVRNLRYNGSHLKFRQADRYAFCNGNSEPEAGSLLKGEDLLPVFPLGSTLVVHFSNVMRLFGVGRLMVEELLAS